jgi:hypothetical protein
VGQKRTRDPSDSRDRESRDGRSNTSEGREIDRRQEGGRGGGPFSTRKEPVNIFRDPARDTTTRSQREDREGREKSDRLPKGKDDGAGPPRGQGEQGATGPFSEPPGNREDPRGKEADEGKEGSQEQPGSREQRPMQSTQGEAPPVRERTEKPWAGEGKKTGGEEESVATLPTVVVDLIDASFEEGGAASEFSNEEGSGEEEMDPILAAKAKKAAYGKAARLKKKAAKEQGAGGEGDTAKALVVTTTGKKPAAATVRIEQKQPTTGEVEEAECGPNDDRPKGEA